MQNLNEIFIAELKNLYALEKQVTEGLLNDSVVFRSKKMNKFWRTFKKCNKTYAEGVRKICKDLEVNPGNTTDSVAAEIVMNLVEIKNSDIDKKVAEAGLFASLTRLLYYKIACYRSAQSIAKSLNDNKAKNQFKIFRKNHEKMVKDLKKLAEKGLLADAIESKK